MSRTPSGIRCAALSQVEEAGSVDTLIVGLAKHNGGIDAKRLSCIGLYGAGPEGRRLAAICRERGIVVAQLVDDDLAKHGTTIEDVVVQPPNRLNSLDRAIPIVIASHRVLNATRRLRELGFKTVVPFAALQVLAPDIFAPHMFYDGWLKDIGDHKQHYEWLVAELADDRSRQVLNAVLQYRLTADPEFLAPIIDTGRYHQGLYHPTGVFDCTSDEIYIDAGAFDGDSLKWFKERVGNRYERIIAFEPDPQTYAKLKANFAGDDRVQVVNMGLHQKQSSLRFRNDASRGAIFVEDGEISMNVVGLDEMLAGGRATFIKMNIEGAEVDALYGAQETIRRWLPKLAISVYHRPSDLWRIPQIVRGFSKRYDLFLRQHDGGVIETVMYATPRNLPRMVA